MHTCPSYNNYPASHWLSNHRIQTVITQFCAPGADANNCAIGGVDYASWVRCGMAFLAQIGNEPDVEGEKNRNDNKWSSPLTCPENQFVYAVCFSGSNADCNCNHEATDSRGNTYTYDECISTLQIKCAPMDEGKEYHGYGYANCPGDNHPDKWIIQGQADYGVTSLCNGGRNADCKPQSFDSAIYDNFDASECGVNQNRHVLAGLHQPPDDIVYEWAAGRRRLEARDLDLIEWLEEIVADPQHPEGIELMRRHNASLLRT